MPAASLEALHDFEGQFSVAAREILVAGGFPAARADGDPSKKPDEVTATKFVVGESTGERAFTAENKPVYSTYLGSLEVLITRRRDDNEEVAVDGINRRLGQSIAKIRALFLESEEPFTAAALPYYRVTDIKPAAPDYAFEDRIDVVVLSWDITFSIAPDAWPTS